MGGEGWGALQNITWWGGLQVLPLQNKVGGGGAEQV